MNLQGLRVHIAFVLLYGISCNRPPIGGGGDNGTDSSPSDRGGTVYVRFTSGGVTLDAATESDGAAQTTTIRSGDETVLRMRTSLTDLQITFPTENNVQTDIAFDPPLEAAPTEFALNRLATLIAGEVFFVPKESPQLQNRPGCDFFPDTRCTLRCCAYHDRCYFDNDCSITSWLPFVGSQACDTCNALVARCIIVTCLTGSEGDPNGAVCFDSTCGVSYSCPDFNCNCQSVRFSRFTLLHTA